MAGVDFPSNFQTLLIDVATLTCKAAGRARQFRFSASIS
jgi:hypothetical protein